MLIRELLCFIERIGHRPDAVARLVAAGTNLKRIYLGESPSRRVHAPRTELKWHEQRQLAQRALELRYRGQKHFSFDAGRLLDARRESDQGNDLWTVYNKVQENAGFPR